MNANYSEALDQQLGLLRAFESRKAAGMSTSHFLRAAAEDDDPVPSMLRLADSYFWGPDQCSLVQFGATSIPAWHFSAEQFESPCGFAWFSKPILIEGKGPYEWGLSALMWCVTPEEDGVFVAGWSYDGTRDVIPDVKGYWSFADALPPLVDDQIWDKTGHYHGDDDDGPNAFTQLMGWAVRVLAASAAFMHQRILITGKHLAERHARKRLERAGWLNTPIVRVVKLRRTERIGKDSVLPVESQWQCQWVVRGHWRQQFYPSKHINQPIWITPYVKGPEDKPLKPPRATVFAVVR